MKRSGMLAVLTVALLFAAASPSFAQQSDMQSQMGHGQMMIEQKSEGDGYLFHISSSADEARRILVPLTLAMIISNDGTPVQLFLDQEAVLLAHKEAKAVTHPDFPKNSNELLDILVKRGVGIAVCPLCMKGEKMSKEDLRDGASLFSPDKLSSFTTGRIITLDW